MKNNKKIIIGLILGILLIASVAVVIIFSNKTKSKNIELETKYKSIIGIKVKSEVILIVDYNNKVSNILFMNNESVKTLANKKIEGKSIEKATELIIDKLKNNNEFKDNHLNLIKYEDNGIHVNFLKELNKQFVIYGIDKNIVEQTSTINIKLDELNIKESNIKMNNLKSIYKYSLKNIENYKK